MPPTLSTRLQTGSSLRLLRSCWVLALHQQSRPMFVSTIPVWRLPLEVHWASFNKCSIKELPCVQEVHWVSFKQVFYQRVTLCARHYCHVDCPGHADYVKNMITGRAFVMRVTIASFLFWTAVLPQMCEEHARWMEEFWWSLRQMDPWLRLVSTFFCRSRPEPQSERSLR